MLKGTSRFAKCLSCAPLGAILFVTLIIDAAAAGDVAMAKPGDPAKGAEKAPLCSACHGDEGGAPLQQEWPKLSGQHASYVEKQLHDYANPETSGREDAQMLGIAQALSAEDMRNVAAYFETRQPRGGFASEDTLVLGEKIYRGGNAESGLPSCMGCHGPTGLGDPLGKIPVLSGQHPAYIALQLQKFRSGERANDRNAMMRGVASRLTDTEIKALSEYLAGLHP